ncbi:MAG: sigma-70 family RNA polymerase sigma factor [Anaerolineae bacterium]|nr:sigma-70 family RNA polymerase sigma factor [Anaerolineae bacterium]
MDSTLTSTAYDEQVLVARAQVEPAAFTAIYDLYFSRIYHYALYRLQDAQTADDITSQVFERVIAKIGTYQPERGPFAPWLFAIARNTINSHLRACQMRRWVSLGAVTNRATSHSTLEEIAIHNEQIAHLMKLISKLDDRSRDLIALKFGAGLTNRRIAEMVGLSESNVGVILYRAIGQLRNQLEPIYKE